LEKKIAVVATTVGLAVPDPVVEASLIAVASSIMLRGVRRSALILFLFDEVFLCEDW
jgi:hypothetical protein